MQYLKSEPTVIRICKGTGLFLTMASEEEN